MASSRFVDFLSQGTTLTVQQAKELRDERELKPKKKFKKVNGLTERKYIELTRNR